MRRTMDFPTYEELCNKAQPAYNPRDHFPFMGSRLLNWSYRITVIIMFLTLMLSGYKGAQTTHKDHYKYDQKGKQ